MVQRDYSGWSKEELIKEVARLRELSRFGLVWEDRTEDVVERCARELPVLQELERLAILDDGLQPTNVLIEGDNYHSLSVLNYTHPDSVDLIYIDPPYNTGHEDFIYNDNYVEADDTFRHSKWLSFMNSRLKLARNLLTQKGMIFVSIDDNEMANLRLLLDQVFGEKNFINCITVKTKSSSGASGGGEDKKLKKNIEYLLWYAKNRAEFSFETLYVSRSLEQVIEDKEGEGKSFEYRSILLDEGDKEEFVVVKDGSGEDIRIFKHTGYKIASIKQVMESEGLSREETYRKYFERVFRTTNAQSSIRTRVMEATKGDNGLFTIEYKPKSGRNKGKIATNYYLGNNSDLFAWLSDTAEKTKTKVLKKEKLGTLWDDLSWNGLATEGGVSFAQGKKPLAFVQRILELSPNKDGIVLDFFAGSGTTGHATLLLNSKDGGNRRFILCTNDEAGIAQNKTYPRIKNAIEGVGKGAPLRANLRYFKTEFVEKQATDDQTRVKLVEQSLKLISLREDAFFQIEKSGGMVLLDNPEHYCLVVFDTQEIGKAIELLNSQAQAKEAHIYIFSLSNDDYSGEFDGLRMPFEIRPIPEGVLEVYRRIFRNVAINEEVDAK